MIKSGNNKKCFDKIILTAVKTVNVTIYKRRIQNLNQVILKITVYL